MTRYTVDDIARFSPWPARLLGQSPWEARVKTPSEIEREFDVEKWGGMLDRARKSPEPVTLDLVDSWASEGAGQSLFFDDGELVEMSPRESHDAYVDWVARLLAPFLPATALFEVGCGYGSVILGLGRRAEFAGLPLYAADYTKAGPALAGLIAQNEGLAVTTGTCDLTRNPVTALGIPEGALVYTSYAAHYAESFDTGLVEGFAALRPATVVHIEPLYQHCDPESVLGLLRRRYIEVNGYNRNMVTLLHEQERRGRIRLVHETRPLFGPNPLLAASVIAWKPERDSSVAAMKRSGGGSPL
jgi:SAM-dependent methyltransferase